MLWPNSYQCSTQRLLRLPHLLPPQVWNYAYGGAVACPDTTAGGGGGLSGRYPFIRDLPAQTELFLNQTAAEQRRWQQGQQAEAGGGGGGGARRRLLVPINWIGNDDVRVSG